MCRNIIALFFLSLSSVWAAPHESSLWDSVLPMAEPRPHHRMLLHSLDEDSLHRFDVLKLSPSLLFDLDQQTLTGWTEISLAADEIPLNRIDFRFTSSLTIDSVWADDIHAASWTEDGSDSLQIWLTPGLGVGDTIQIGVAYHGHPAQIDSWGGLRFAQASGNRPQIAFSMGDGLTLDPPPANYNWIPTHADPTDKVLWDAHFSSAAGRCVSVGELRDTTNHEDYTTWHYVLDQPVSTYLLAIAVSDYTEMIQRESGPLIVNYVYPAYEQAAQTHFANVPTVLDSFTAWFGPYPFPRFGYAMTRIGDMEHATCVYHLDQTVGPNHTYDWLLFHEMSHQWWGDWVTCGDWRDLWLNEGFATYCEALSMEALHGRQSYQDYVVNDLFNAALHTSENFPIYDPSYYWGTTVYEKGACVMHMLRQLLGDSSFFSAWREYGQEHAFGTAVTSDWQAKLEEYYGESLDWFFQPWVYGVRYPQYQVTLQISDITELTIEQTQTTGTRFRMPIDVQMISYSDDTVRFTLWNNATASQTWRIDSLGVHGSQRSMLIDPENKILKTATYRTVVAADDPPASLPTEFRISGIYPNPFNPTTTIRFDLPYSSAVHLNVFDLLGRRVSQLNLGTLSAGTHKTTWDGSNYPSGIYLFRLVTQQDSRTTKAVLLK